MSTNLRWKLISIVVITGLAVWAIYPPGERIRLGLDLKGGVHMVLRVQTDDALQVESETAAEQLGEQLSLDGIDVTSVIAVDPTTIHVEGVPPGREEEFEQIADEQLQVNYNQNQVPGAGGSYTFTFRPNIELLLRGESVTQALTTIERRVNELGVTEPFVGPYGGAGDQILVQLPGVTDINRAKEIIRSTALLELKIVEEGPAPSREALLQARGGVVPSDMEVVSGVDDILSGGTLETVYLPRSTRGGGHRA